MIKVRLLVLSILIVVPIMYMVCLSPNNMEISSIDKKSDRKERIYSDYQIKKTGYENKLTKKEIYFLLSRPLENSIEKYKDSFSCSIVDLKIATTSIICLETGNLKSKSILVNNLFGIKKMNDRPNFIMITNEFYNNKMVIVNDNFSAFYSIEDCINHFYKLITTHKRYYKVRTSSNYHEFFIELSDAGYATDPKYVNKLERISDEIRY